VDNRGDYPSVGDETVIRPHENLGWAAGTNRGTAETLTSHHAAAVWMNNDTRLARGFMGGLVRCWRESGAGLIAPSYDCYWNHQRVPRVVEVSQYQPRRRHFSVPFVDGTCMFVPTSTLDAVGMLDEATFAPVGYGADIDYGLRVRARGMSVVVTRLAYLHHEKFATAKEVFAGGLEEYGARGYPVMETGMTAKWGAEWRHLAGIDPATGQTKRPTLKDWAVAATASVSRRLSASRRHSSLWRRWAQ
jgi:GT2 family glycosyltransferase